ncbi:MAG: PQQ-dependent sugar dehydrogenase [Pirellulaceae bacterium]|nr:PQQ-dependent sugar dehydrogenase [Pirellulaceae bacterium]
MSASAYLLKKRPRRRARRANARVLILALGVALLGCAAATTRAWSQQRPDWTSSRMLGSPDPPPPYRLKNSFPKLKFTNPTVVTTAPDSERLFVVELTGQVYSFPMRSDVKEAELFADLSKIAGMERAYGLTFHPDYANNGFCFACYTVGQELPEGTRVSRFRVVAGNPPTLDLESEEILLKWKSGGHNGGCLKFGPDGFLYVATGDGGPAFPPDPLESGQTVDNLRSSILRLDVDRAAEGRKYSIPKDNPFVNLPDARGEVWAYGFRNPWKMSFDTATGDLWVGDVGWEMWEMIYRVERAGNYGWSLVEASQPVHRERTRGPTPILPPTAAHSHTESRSITGGFVYRGDTLPALRGAYIYGDYVTGKIWGLRHDGKQVVKIDELVDSSLQVIAFAQREDGEIYVVGYDGTIHQLVESPSRQGNPNFPKKLSETGVFASTKDHKLAAGVVPYEVIAEPWEDHATSERFVGLPGDAALGVHDSTNVQVGYIKGQWAFPENGLLGKTISLELKRGDPATKRRLETQILHFYDGSWRAYNYIWNEEQTDAVRSDGKASQQDLQIIDPRAPGGKTTQTWRHASRGECLLCHTTRAGTVHGFQPEQLNRESGDGNQLSHFERIGLFQQPPPKRVKTLVAPHAAAGDLTDRARSYLHVNCAHCHRRGGGGSAAIDVQWAHDLPKTNLLDARPTQGVFDIHRAEVLAQGDPYRSVLYYRMAKLGRGRMPHFGSQVVDRAGVSLMRDWIASLAPAEEPDAATIRRRAEQRRAAGSVRAAKNPAAARQAIEQLLQTTSGALLLAESLDDERVAATVRAAVLDESKSAALARRDLFERFLPPEQRVKRLGSIIQLADILNQPGDADRGRQLFEKAAGVQCRNCHKIGDIGKPLGPDLVEIARKQTPTQLLESILQPSKRIDPKYQTYLVETADGRVVSGLLKERSAQQVVLLDATNKEHRIAGTDVEVILPQQKSLMPELLLQDLTARQAADLLQFFRQTSTESE